MSTHARSIHKLGVAFVCLVSIVLAGEAPAQSTWQKMKLNVLQQECQQGLQKACQSLAEMKQKQTQQGTQQQPVQTQTQTQQSSQQPQGQPATSLQGGTTAGAVSAESSDAQAGGSQEAWAPPTGDSASTPSKPAGPLDPMKLPDIQGLHPGMTVTQANEVMAKLAPGARIPWYNSAMYVPTSNIVAGHAASQLSLQYDWVAVGGGAKNYKLQLALEATRPPNEEYVWHIGLRAQLQYVNRAVLISALRKKYGKELVATDPQDQPTTDETRIANLWWAFDEQGRPKSPAPSLVNGSLNGCGDAGFELSSLARFGGGGGTANGSGGKDTDPGCMFVGLRAQIPWPAEIVTYYGLTLWDAPLSVREFKATDAWLQVQLEKARQDALQKSKEAKPTL